MGDDATLETLQELVNGFSLDVGRVRAALADDKTEEPAKKLLVGALSYVIDTWDMFPDHYRGVGLADDALVLRVACKLAQETGASHRIRLVPRILGLTYPSWPHLLRPSNLILRKT